MHHIKRFTALLLCFSMLAGFLGMSPWISTAVYAEETESINLLAGHNPSFEDGLQEGSTNEPKGWSDFNGTDNNYAPSTAFVTDGTYSLEMKTGPDASTNEGGFTNAVAAVVSEWIDVSGMERLQATMDVRGTGITNIFIVLFDSEKQQVSSKYKAVTPNEDDWTQATVTVDVTPDVKYARVRLHKSHNEGHAGTVYMDNVVLKETDASVPVPTEPKPTTPTTPSGPITPPEPIGPADPNNMLAAFNGTFEYGHVEGNPNLPVGGWKSWLRLNTFVTQEKVKDGNWAVKVISGPEAEAFGGNTKSVAALVSPMVSVDGINKVIVSLDMVGTGSTNFYVTFYDEYGKTLGENHREFKPSADEWNNFSFAQVAPVGAKFACVRVHKSTGEENLGTVYVDNLSMKIDPTGANIERPAPVEPGEYVEPSDPDNLFNDFNQSFEYGLMEGSKYIPAGGWTAWNAGNLIPSKAGGAVHGEWALRMISGEAAGNLQDGVTNGVTALLSPKVEVTGMERVVTSINVKGTGTVNLYLQFYDEDMKLIVESMAVARSPLDWTKLVVSALRPENAKYAAIRIHKGMSHVLDPGTSYVDDICIKEWQPPKPGDNSADDVYVAEEKHYEWNIIETEHPRLYFTKAGLEEIKKFSRLLTITPYGYTGKDVYDKLIAEAEGYLKETQFHATWDKTTVTFQVYPVFEDCTIVPEFANNPYGGSKPYPYMDHVGELVMARVQTLALAYSVSGDMRYAERAMRYAMDICNWQYWVGYHYTIQNGGEDGQETSETSILYQILSVATVYDMCYDLLTEEQKEIMETSLIEKGIKHIAKDVVRRMARNRDSDFTASIFFAVCAIINEENKEELGLYLDRALYYCDWMTNFYRNGHNEGISYAAYGLDFMMEGLAVMERVTGQTAILDGPFCTEELPKWSKGFAETAKGTMAGYCDSNYIPEFEITLMVLNQRGDIAAGYLLAKAGGFQNTFHKMLYTNNNKSMSAKPSDEFDNVTILEKLGIASLRTGWNETDSLLVLVSDDYGMNHSHFECNTLALAIGGEWLIRDRGYVQSASDGTDRWTYRYKYDNNTVFVDGLPQQIRGASTGKIKQVFGSTLYGYILGSAPNAYGLNSDGTKVLDQFDRHTIMVNHTAQPYYVVFDELDSNREHVYSWNWSKTNWEMMEVDGKPFALEDSATGNRLAQMYKSMVMHTEFIGNPMTFGSYTYMDFEPLMKADAPKAQDTELMTIISVNPSFDGFKAINSSALIDKPGVLDFENKCYLQEYNDPDGFAWKTGNNGGYASALYYPQNEMMAFRASDLGDWISFPFEMDEGGEYSFAVTASRYSNNQGLWQFYLDGEKIGEPYCPYGTQGDYVNVEMGVLNLSAGKHILKCELVGEVNPDKAWNTNIHLGQVVLASADTSLGEAPAKVVETYHDDSVIGGKINYYEEMFDVVMMNRGEGQVSAGDLTTNGHQASVLGVNNDVIQEGYTATKATSLSYKNIQLFSAEKPLDVAADLNIDRINYWYKSGASFEIVSAEAQQVKLYVGQEFDSVKLGETALDYTVEGDLLVISVPAGTSTVTVELASEQTPVTPTEPTAPTTPSTPAPTEPAAPAPNNVWIWIVVAVVAVAAIGVAVVLVLKSKKK